MANSQESRFDAEEVGRLSALNQTRRLELRFTGADEREHVVTLPVEAAVALGRLICDLAEGTPFLAPDDSPPEQRPRS